MRDATREAAAVQLSVVIAAYDAEPYLAAALESVLREAPADAEIIVVDDGSRDATGDIARRHGERVKLLHNDVPTGPGRARNAGARVASGDVLAFHDADDLVLPGRFALLQAVLEARPEIDLVFANGARCDAGGRRLGPVIGARQARRLLRRCDLEEMLRGGVVYPQGMSIRRARFLALGGFVAERGEDWDFALRAALRLRMAYVDREVFAYRQNPASVTSRRREFGETLVRVLERFVAAHPEAAAVVGAARLDAARASQLARVARLRLADGDRAGATAAWDAAVALVPMRLRYRWRCALARYAGR
ncbi:glycosyltransferase [Candidatus Binatia bacterium]|nr:glycosyltransferase [Candidatus Binatia bacterium]